MDYSSMWSNDNNMRLNVTKTKIMHLSTKANYCASYTNSLNNVPLQTIGEMKFLGIIIDSRLTFNAHCEAITKKATQRQSILLKLKRNGVHQSKLKLFYLTNIRSILTYCAPSFFSLLSNKKH